MCKKKRFGKPKQTRIKKKQFENLKIVTLFVWMS